MKQLDEKLALLDKAIELTKQKTDLLHELRHALIAHGGRPNREITSEDVGRPQFRFFGGRYLVSSFIGKILPKDVGRLVYEVTPGVLQVESADQRDNRIAARRRRQERMTIEKNPSW